MAKKKKQQPPKAAKPKKVYTPKNPPPANIKTWLIIPTQIGQGLKEIEFKGSKSQARKKAQKHFKVGGYRLEDKFGSKAQY